MGETVILGGYYNGLPITEVAQQALMNCSWIKNAIILDTIEHMKAEVFIADPLEKVYFEALEPADMVTNIFGYNRPIVYVKEEAYDAYYNYNDPIWITDIRDNIVTYEDSGIVYDEFFNGEYSKEVTESSIKINLSLEDNDEVLSSIKAQLILGEEVVQELTNNSLELLFEGLLSNTKYELIISYSYDLNDGEGSKEETINTYLYTVLNYIRMVV